MSEAVVLGIDTSGSSGSVALLSPRAEVEEVFERGLIHGVALGPAVQSVLDRAGAGIEDVTLIAVGTGPGSYTGVRVAVAFAKTLAFARGLPVVGVPSFDALAAGAPPGRTVVCVRDARRDALYYAAYRPGPDGPEVTVPLRLLALDELEGVLPEEALVIGDAVDRFGDLLSGDRRELGGVDLWESRASIVARLGEALFRRRGTDEVHDLSPVYLRLPEAEERLRARRAEE